MAKETLLVPAVSCMHCVRRISEALTGMPGVLRVHVDLATKQVTVTYEGADTPARVRSKLEEIGYPAAA